MNRNESLSAALAISVVGVIILGREAYSWYRKNTRVERVFALIDNINKQDPRDPPQEYDYGLRMTAMLARYDPSASDEVKIACRGQHVARWQIRRNEYPEGKAGYLRWRKALYAMHSGIINELLASTGDFTDAEITKTAALVGKQWDLKSDSDANAVEDCAALVFLQHYFPAFSDKLNEVEKMVDIVRKTWAKMSPRGRDLALKLTLAPAQLEIVQKALSSGAPAPSNEDE